MNKNILRYVAISVLVGALAVMYLVLSYTPFEYAQGSAIQGNEYQSTSTAPTNLFGGNTNAIALLKTGSGSLAQVVIPTATLGAFSLYDATTTDATKRAPAHATSSSLLVTFPKGTVAGTYTFDLTFSRGLTYTTYAGETLATSTIMWR